MKTSIRLLVATILGVVGDDSSVGHSADVVEPDDLSDHRQSVG
jgi:hypothetical protein